MYGNYATKGALKLRLFSHLRISALIPVSVGDQDQEGHRGVGCVAEELTTPGEARLDVGAPRRPRHGVNVSIELGGGVKGGALRSAGREVSVGGRAPVLEQVPRGERRHGALGEVFLEEQLVFVDAPGSIDDDGHVDLAAFGGAGGGGGGGGGGGEGEGGAGL